MRNKLIPICASFVIILSVLACSLASGQTTAQPDLAATITAQAFALDIETITAQAQALQSSNATPAPANATSAPADTAQPADTQPPNNPPQPVNTQGPTSPSKPKNFKANGSAAAITFTWDDNTGEIGASALDKTLLVVYNPTQNQAVTVSQLAERADGTQTVTVPDSFSGDLVQCYMAFINVDGQVSNSAFAGAVTVA